MAKELPYFQFEPAEYLTKDISFCSLQAQGLFMNICAYYWQRNCEITQEQILRRLNYPIELKELLDEGIIDIENDKIVIKFLNNQMFKATKTSEKNSGNGALGGAKIGNKNASKKEKQPKNEPKTTQKQGIREDKIKEDEIIEENITQKDAYEFLKFKNLEEVEAFEMQNKKSFKNSNSFDAFIENFNNKVTLEGIPYEPQKLFARLRMLNANWDKKPKEELVETEAVLNYGNPNR